MLNLIFLIVGIVIGYLLNKEKVRGVASGFKSYLVKPSGRVIDSKEENSLNKIEDEVNYQHNSYFDEQEG